MSTICLLISIYCFWYLTDQLAVRGLPLSLPVIHWSTCPAVLILYVVYSYASWCWCSSPATLVQYFNFNLLLILLFNYTIIGWCTAVRCDIANGTGHNRWGTERSSEARAGWFWSECDEVAWHSQAVTGDMESTGSLVGQASVGSGLECSMADATSVKARDDCVRRTPGILYIGDRASEICEIRERWEESRVSTACIRGEGVSCWTGSEETLLQMGMCQYVVSGLQSQWYGLKLTLVSLQCVEDVS